MPDINENCAKIKHYSSEISSLSAGVRSVKDAFDCCAGRLDGEIRSFSNIDRRVGNIVRELETEIASCEKILALLSDAAGTIPKEK